jgi:hypothetical protein
MIIADLDHLNSIPDSFISNIDGGKWWKGSSALSNFYALASGEDTYTGAFIQNFASGYPNRPFAYSHVKVTSAAVGGNASATASSSSFASA